ncbi:GspMb/PilO family protein [Roseateles sp. LYH14W]|uniref:GspMb/PilO family protein n=1 Tax=Pelomonas parva TaxID=3299032 RepID=A0ABW7FCC6_9BURK
MKLAIAAPLSWGMSRLSPRRLSIGLSLSAFVLIGASQGIQWHFQNLQQSAVADLADAQRQLSATLANSSSAAATEPPFVDRLPASQDNGAPLLHQIQRSFSAAGVTLTASSVSTESATASTLGKQRIVLAVKGPYAAIKACLADLLGRLPSLTVLNLSLRAPATGSELDGQIELLALSKPLAATRPSTAP